jgi:hypothetical protein
MGARIMWQVGEAAFSAHEWGALLECQAVLFRLRNREEKIRIVRRGWPQGVSGWLERVADEPVGELARGPSGL